MLGKASHGHKVNFCKFTNETRLSIEDASENSGQTYLAAISGSAAGGGYELAVTADHIMLIDDRRSSVSLPELPLLAVLPGTGGLTRLTDKRRVRRDRADIFCTAEEGVRGKRAVEWRLVDEVVPPSAWEAKVTERALELAAQVRPRRRKGIALTPLDRTIIAGRDHLPACPGHPRPRRPRRHHHHPGADRHAGRPARHPRQRRCLLAAGDGAANWTTPAAPAPERASDRLAGFPLRRRSRQVLAADSLLEQYQTDWLVREIRLLLKRVLQARRHDGAQPDHPDRARKLLRRHARRTRLRRRPRA